MKKCEIGKQLSQILPTLRTIPAFNPGSKNNVSLDITDGGREKMKFFKYPVKYRKELKNRCLYWVRIKVIVITHRSSVQFGKSIILKGKNIAFSKIRNSYF